MIRETFRQEHVQTKQGHRGLPGLPSFDWTLPPEREAAEPPEARGLARDAVRLMVSHYDNDEIDHAQFRDLPQFLSEGDLLIINTSGTLNAALQATRGDRSTLELHLSTRLPNDQWVVEVRRLTGQGTAPVFTMRAGETLDLPAGAFATLHTPYTVTGHGGTRLWVATLRLPGTSVDYLAEHGFPIRYSYVRDAWPASYYQTVYVTEMGSAEMPSAGRAFTPELITRLVAQGVQVMPLVLHTGVASLEANEPPYEEFYRVPAVTASAVNAARAAGRRVIAVGTTVVRALESATDQSGIVRAQAGWTELVITPERGMRVVDGLITGFHEPQATHLAMLAALCGLPHLQLTYAAALHQGYLWHEFGDLHLILP